MKTIIIFCCFLVLCSFAPQVEEEPYFVKMKNTKIASFSTNKIDIQSEAVFFNTYAVGAKLLEVNIDVFYEDTKLGTIIEVKDVKIPKKSSFDIPLQLAIKPGPTALKLISGSAKLVFGGKVKIGYVGYVKIRALGMIPIKIKLDQTDTYEWKDLFPPSK